MLEIIAFRTLTSKELTKFFEMDKEFCTHLAMKAYGNINRRSICGGYFDAALHGVCTPYIFSPDRMREEMADFGMLECLEYIENIEDESYQISEGTEMAINIAASGNVLLFKEIMALIEDGPFHILFGDRAHRSTPLANIVWTNNAEIISALLDALPPNTIKDAAAILFRHALKIENLYIARSMLSHRYVQMENMVKINHPRISKEFVEQYRYAVSHPSSQIIFPKSLMER